MATWIMSCLANTLPGPGFSCSLTRRLMVRGSPPLCSRRSFLSFAVPRYFSLGAFFRSGLKAGRACNHRVFKRYPPLGETKSAPLFEIIARLHDVNTSAWLSSQFESIFKSKYLIDRPPRSQRRCSFSCPLVCEVSCQRRFGSWCSPCTQPKNDILGF